MVRKNSECLDSSARGALNVSSAPPPPLLLLAAPTAGRRIGASTMIRTWPSGGVSTVDLRRLLLLSSPRLALFALLDLVLLPLAL